MARYIDADKLIKSINRQIDKAIAPEEFKEMVRQALLLEIANVPTIDAESLNTKHEEIGYEKGYRDGYAEALEVTDDAVPVVRCKDCRYRDRNVCDYSAVYVRPHGYCQWGRRKEDETD